MLACPGRESRVQPRTAGRGRRAIRPVAVGERFAVPETGVFEPLVANVYWQLFAYHVVDLKGRSIDKPRNLAKSVTVE